jgi:hypothetical protein
MLIATELNSDLQFVSTSSGIELQGINNHGNFLPGQPRISLSDTTRLEEYVKKAFVVPDLDQLAPKLWLVSLQGDLVGRLRYTIDKLTQKHKFATPHFTHISYLHHQAARGRKIVVVEDPNLHLIWYYDRIFLKPIPPYLLSSAFLQYLGAKDREAFKAAVGFLRSYSCLIHYETDFREAQDNLHLIPKKKGQNDITFEEFAKFIGQFADIKDDSVTPRYQYGELRLTRLNLLVRVLFKRLTFFHINAQWNIFFGRLLTPFLTLFLILATALTAMQVELAVQGLKDESGSWVLFSRASRYFSVVVIFSVAIAILASLILGLVMAIHDFTFARSVLRHKKTSVDDAAMRKSGIV